jgi:hypothetical protein
MAAPSCYIDGMKEQRPAPKPEEIEELPDAWERFEKAFDTVMKAKPKPAPAKKKPATSSGKRDGTKPV